MNLKTTNIILCFMCLLSIVIIVLLVLRPPVSESKVKEITNQTVLDVLRDLPPSTITEEKVKQITYETVIGILNEYDFQIVD